MTHAMRVAIETLGCKLNQAETETLARQFAAAGCEVVPPHEKADIYILNSCTVTHIADRKGRHFLRMAKRVNPDAFIVATGCYVNRAATELNVIDGIKLVVSNEDKPRLTTLVLQCFDLSHMDTGQGHSLRTRAFIKAQDGCNRLCAYCIVPLVRGREKSLPVGEVVAEVRIRVAEGYQEVVLTGTEIGSYVFDGLRLKELLERVLAETDIKRLRLSSLQPYEITPQLLALWDNPRLCPHFHLSLQSGADSVLSRMKRGYNTAGYERAVGLIREAMSAAAITTDIIVGFPGETDAEFQEGLDYCHRTGFTRIHVFPFSARPGTVAAAMPGQISAPVKKERVGKMLALAKESARAFHSRFLGRTVEVLWEQKSDAGVWSGYTANYIRVYARSERDLTNSLEPTQLVKLYGDGAWGELMRKDDAS